MSFKLTITLGNDAMSDNLALSAAIRKVAAAVQRIDDGGVSFEEMEHPYTGPVMDINGNRVGGWTIGE